MEVKIGIVPATMVDVIWEDLAQGFENSCRKTGGDLTSHSLWVECRSGGAFLVTVMDGETLLAASIWRFERWTQMGSVLRCLAFFGRDAKSWITQHAEFIRHMARVGGATELVAEGRLGIQRLIKGSRVLRQLYAVPV